MVTKFPLVAYTESGCANTSTNQNVLHQIEVLLNGRWRYGMQIWGNSHLSNGNTAKISNTISKLKTIVCDIVSS